MLGLIAAKFDDLVTNIRDLASERSLTHFHFVYPDLAGLFKDDIILDVLAWRLVFRVERTIKADVPVL